MSNVYCFSGVTICNGGPCGRSVERRCAHPAAHGIVVLNCKQPVVDVHDPIVIHWLTSVLSVMPWTAIWIGSLSLAPLTVTLRS